MNTAIDQEQIKAMARATEENRPYYVTRLRGIVAADDFNPALHGKIMTVFYPPGYQPKTSYKLPERL